MSNNQFIPYNPTNDLSQSRRNLPHWYQENATYFVTFRCADSLPQTKLDELQRYKTEWLSAHPEPWSAADRCEYYETFAKKIDSWLDHGYGACLLQKPDIASIVAAAFNHFDQQRYTLDTYVIMPNHVHLIVKPWSGYPLVQLLHSWKSFTSIAINKAVGQKGGFWMNESYDHVVRSWEQLEHYRKYIAENPIKARLSHSSYLLGRGLESLTK